MFNLVSKYQPNGNQPKAIKNLTDGINTSRILCIILSSVGNPQK